MTILAGLPGAGGVVAAGAVVRREVPAGMLVTGSPARVVRPLPYQA
jgi:acetyltransferase-like isoleucine patch superfamily enzyme